MANSVDLDEVTHHEPPHQDLRCFQIQLFSSLVLKELKYIGTPSYFLPFLFRKIQFFVFFCIALLDNSTERNSY